MSPLISLTDTCLAYQSIYQRHQSKTTYKQDQRSKAPNKNEGLKLHWYQHAIISNLIYCQQFLNINSNFTQLLLLFKQMLLRNLHLKLTCLLIFSLLFKSLKCTYKIMLYFPYLAPHGNLFILEQNPVNAQQSQTNPSLLELPIAANQSHLNKFLHAIKQYGPNPQTAQHAENLHNVSITLIIFFSCRLGQKPFAFHQKT